MLIKPVKPENSSGSLIRCKKKETHQSVVAGISPRISLGTSSGTNLDTGWAMNRSGRCHLYQSVVSV